ncbi:MULTISPECIES: sulfatase [unclassified Lentimonas]|uniref:sulfatase family protein n=1 Tax=unclassified Lentimonas TaxID=2630993 RepID=UPI00132BE80C|nr:MULTISPECIES: sulfatase [unclassified Lentimonas]CAA6676277.1 Choline-sulfatase (EC [Lentimonas sp. CC4]CAA6683834.1 Choline-sulfatase (EC [Lentimonas sp. CC6]CAA7077768.1 Choline-sulfatase (EC [Lentimonas sp. CC4]CAA7169702.1 Choline-sulfatase (EC [Lentimonas sp. CC21]CAA7179523.1 Choline-sulfatase (EC [Lentimonas sp. CC8]
MHLSTKLYGFLALLIGLCAGVSHAMVTPSPTINKRPNIIWLMAEDMGTDLECYGTAGVRTPNLNRLAAEGARFTKAYCANPICSPNRSSMMVGVNQTRINAQHHRSNRDVPLMAPYKPITYWMRDAGYTAILGSDLVMKGGKKIDCNFKTAPLGSYDGVTNFGLFDKELDFSAADQPFFNQIQLVVTHRGDWWNGVRAESKHPVDMNAIELPPFMADTPEIRYDWAAYLDTVEYMDNEVGQIMQKLEDEGLENNTIVIFIADNGRCNLRGKGYLQDPGIHIPMIVWAPGLIEAGTVIDELVCTTDISATVLKLTGSTIPDYITSKPFLGTDQPEYRQYVRSARDIWDEIDDCSRSITTKQFKYIKNHMPEIPWETDQAYLELNRPAMHVMRQLKKEGKLSDVEMIFMHDEKPVEELYDLENDPDELNNLASNPEYAVVLEQMRANEATWLQQNRDFGLEDLGNRQVEENMSSVLVRKGVKANAPDLWNRLESGELMETQSWKKYKSKN